MGERVPWVDPDVCVGTTACTELCPKVFRLNEGGKAEVYNPKGAPEDRIQEAIDACPVHAINWIER